MLDPLLLMSLSPAASPEKLLLPPGFDTLIVLKGKNGEG
jgi:hypothetical protein